MSLLDQLSATVHQALGATGGEHSTTINHILETLGNPQSGGLAGLVQAFESKGLGNVIGSWIGSGPNQAISPQALQNVLGDAHIQDLAKKLGVNPADAAAKLAKVLPEVINHLTPNGQMPSGDILSQGLSMLKKALR